MAASATHRGWLTKHNEGILAGVYNGAMPGTTLHAANTALGGVLVGTPVTPALAVDSIVISNAVASGDILIAANNGGNSQAWLNVDSSAGTMTLYGAGTTAAILSSTAVAVQDDILLGVGTGSTARLSYDTTDANANELLLQLPAGGAVDVPVIAIGQSIESVDLGLYNGQVDPLVALFGVGAVATSPILEFRKARGTIAAPTAITTGDDLGIIRAYAAVAAGEYVESVRLTLDSTGTIATTRGAGIFKVAVATDAAPSVMTERVSVTGSGLITMTPATDVAIANGTGLIVGYTAQVAAGAVTSEVQVHGTAPADSTALLAAWSADAVPPRLYFAKSRSATIGTFGIITSGDNLGEILAFGDDGVDFNSNGNASAAIIFDSAGTIAADRIAGVIRLQTATDAAPSVLTTALTIDQAQVVTMASTLVVQGASATVGVAGTTTGTLVLAGATSGTCTLTPAAAAGSWTMTLPAAANTNAGYQLTCAGADSITSWGAAGSLRELKDIQGTHDAQDALDKILNTRVYDFHYKPGKGTQDHETDYVGVMADDAPWAMHYKQSVVNPVNALGYTVLGFQALAARLAAAEAKLAALEAA